MRNHQALLEIPSAWHGLEDIANWIVETVRPHVTVDLGVDHGFSTCVLATAGFGKVYGIDLNDDRLNYARKFALEHAIYNVEFICADYNTVAAQWSLPVDILHIDGHHDYENVSKDFNTWVPHLRQGGVLLMHDIDSFKDGPGRVFNDIPWPKWGIHKFSGLGVATKPYVAG